VDENQTTLNIAQLVADGFMHSKEPFAMTLLHLWRAWSIKLIKEKARLLVTEGAVVFGCVDETGILRGHIAPKPSESHEAEPQEPPVSVPDLLAFCTSSCNLS
jgi:RNA-dependent RNA polymerase